MDRAHDPGCDQQHPPRQRCQGQRLIHTAAVLSNSDQSSASAFVSSSRAVAGVVLELSPYTSLTVALAFIGVEDTALTDLLVIPLLLAFCVTGPGWFLLGHRVIALLMFTARFALVGLGLVFLDLGSPDGCLGATCNDTLETTVAFVVLIAFLAMPFASSALLAALSAWLQFRRADALTPHQ